MKKLLLKFVLLILVFFSLVSCKIVKDPVYKEIKDFGISSLSLEEVEIKGNILFYNPNLVGVDIETEELSVWFKGNQISKAKTEKFKVPAKSDFIIPITLKVEVQKFIKNSTLDILESLIGGLNGKSYEVNIKGNIFIRKFGIKYTYKLDEVKKISF